MGRITDLRPHLQTAGVVVLPSIIDSDGETETLGQSLVEAISCGTPVIGSCVGGIPEVVNMDVGILVNDNDVEMLRKAIIDLKNNIEWQKEKKENARKQAVEKFSIHSHINKLKEIYAEVTQ